MKLTVIVHEAEEGGGYWAEVPAIAGCVTQGETLKELMDNLHEAITGCLTVDIEAIETSATDQVMEITV